jgi:hypothetical protein
MPIATTRPSTCSRLIASAYAGVGCSAAHARAKSCTLPPPFSLSLSLSLSLSRASLILASACSSRVICFMDHTHRDLCRMDGAEAASGTLLRISSLALLTCFAG